VLDRLPFPDFPVLRGERVLLRAPRSSDIDDRLAHPVDPEEEDGYGSAWRREWDGRPLPDRNQLIAAQWPPHPEWGIYPWSVEHEGRCVGSAQLNVDADQHRARYSVGLFVAGLRGHGLGREITGLVLGWAFGPLGAHRVELEVLAGNQRAIRCYEACGFRHEGVRRDAELYPDGWKDFLHMGILRAEYRPS
jgi:RimJ/RimL family protein N-acetyltransferase